MTEAQTETSLQVDEAAMLEMAAQLSGLIIPPLVIWLEGELGAGKTTFARALIQGLGYKGRVKSPTYGLLEHYELEHLQVLHLDLYRLVKKGELEFLGITDLFDSNTLLLVEWPEKGGSQLPAPDLEIQLAHLPGSRNLSCHAHSDSGKRLCGFVLDYGK